MRVASKVVRKFIQESVVRRFITATEQKVALEFPNEDALKAYFNDHPKAKRKNHWVKGQRPEGATLHEQARKRKPGGGRKKKNPDAAPKKEETAVTVNPWKEDAKPKEEKKEEKKDKKEKKADPDAPKKHPFQGKLKIEKRKFIGEGMTGAELLTITDESGKSHKGVWKSVKGELAVLDRYGELRESVPAGTYYEREAVSSNFDSIFGGKRVIPETFTQEFEDDETGEKMAGSLQVFKPGTMTQKDVINHIYNSPRRLQDENIRKLGKSFEAKKMFFMDIISANDDRHSGNSLWEKSDKFGYTPIAIDNGLTFPDGESSRFLYAVDNKAYKKEVCKPDGEIRQHLESLDLQKLADMLNASDNLSKTAKLLTLTRAQALKNNPDLMYDKSRDVENDNDYNDSYDDAMFNWINSDGTARVENGEITAAEYEKIRSMVTERKAKEPQETWRYKSDSELEDQDEDE